MRKKHILLIFSILVFFFSLFLLADAASDDLANKLSGRILLQVESHGEAWYINPETKERNYLGRPDDAFNVMRQAGIGAKNSDLDRIPVALDNLSGEDSDSDGLPDNLEVALGLNPNNSDSDGDSFSDYVELQNSYNPLGTNKLSFDNSFSKAQAGRILLQVERNGEAWYINPENNKRYFLGRPSDAYNLMRRLGLGISNENLEQINQNQFSHQSAKQNGVELEVEDGTGENGDNLLTEQSVNFDDFEDKLLNCEVGTETVYSQDNEVNLSGLIVASKTDSQVYIEEKIDDECNIIVDTNVFDVTIKNLDEYISETLEEIKEILVDNTGLSTDYINNLFNTQIINISEEDRVMLLETGFDDVLFVEENSLKTLLDVIKEEGEKNLEDMLKSEQEFQQSKSVCTGQPESLLEYLIGNTGTVSCILESNSTNCSYENGVVCTSLATE